MGDNATQEREDFEQLLASPGWHRFMEHVRKEWGTPGSGGGVEFLRATRDAVNGSDQVQALNHLRQICAAQKCIHALTLWPEEQFKAASKAEQKGYQPVTVSFSRSGV